MSDDQTAWQPSLLGLSEPLEIDESITRLERIEWGQQSRHMYDRVVEEPRLTSSWRASKDIPLEPAFLNRCG